jgi:hypothetical protein
MRPDDGQRYYAPWRADPRLASGLLQGTYAFLGVSGFWRCQRKPPHTFWPAGGPLKPALRGDSAEQARAGGVGVPAPRVRGVGNPYHAGQPFLAEPRAQERSDSRARGRRFAGSESDVAFSAMLERVVVARLASRPQHVLAHLA